MAEIPVGKVAKGAGKVLGWPLMAGLGAWDAHQGVKNDDQGFMSNVATGSYSAANGMTFGGIGKLTDHFGLTEDGKSPGEQITENEKKSAKLEKISGDLSDFNAAKRERWEGMSPSERRAAQHLTEDLSAEQLKARSEKIKKATAGWDSMSKSEQEKVLTKYQGKDYKAGEEPTLNKIKDNFLTEDGKINGLGKVGLAVGGVAAAGLAVKMFKDWVTPDHKPELSQMGMQQGMVPVAQNGMMPTMTPMGAMAPTMVPVPVEQDRDIPFVPFI